MSEKIPQKDESKVLTQAGSFDKKLGTVALQDKFESQPNYNHVNFGGFTIENTRGYNKDRMGQNLELIKQYNDPHVAELYTTLMSEYPQLRNVRLEQAFIERNANYVQWTKNGFAPRICYNFADRKTYILNEQVTNSEISIDSLEAGWEYLTKRVALEVGADWRECVGNERLMADETFLHEFGHAHDFFENFLKPEYQNVSGNHRGPEALYRASVFDDVNRQSYTLAGPDAGNPIRRRSKEWRKMERRLAAMGINNYDEYIYARRQYYRDQPDESYADKFAADFILRHFDDYFTTDRNNHETGRVFVDPNKEIHLDQDFVHVLGLKQGLGVTVSRMIEGKVVKQTSGFLATNMYVGKNMYLYENGDPKNPGNKWRICQGISDIRIKPVRNVETGELRRYVLFTDENGIDYNIGRTHTEVPLVAGTPAEMMDDLGIKAGDEVQLIGRATSDARKLDFSEAERQRQQIGVKDGKVMAWDERSIMISCGNSVAGRVITATPRRKWKTWYVGGYEVLPLPK